MEAAVGRSLEKPARRALLGLWLAGNVLVLVTGVRGSRIPSLKAAFRLPATPIDLASPPHARFWGFLHDARAKVPPGSSYTTVGTTREDDMDLFMLSLGIFVGRQALPSSYFGVPSSSLGSQAQYVLVFGQTPTPGEDLRLIARIGEGRVFQRTRRD